MGMLISTSNLNNQNFHSTNFIVLSSYVFQMGLVLLQTRHIPINHYPRTLLTRHQNHCRMSLLRRDQNIPHSPTITKCLVLDKVYFYNWKQKFKDSFSNKAYIYIYVCMSVKFPRELIEAPADILALQSIVCPHRWKLLHFRCSSKRHFRCSSKRVSYRLTFCMQHSAFSWCIQMPRYILRLFLPSVNLQYFLYSVTNLGTWSLVL